MPSAMPNWRTNRRINVVIPWEPSRVSWPFGGLTQSTDISIESTVLLLSSLKQSSSKFKQWLKRKTSYLCAIVGMTTKRHRTDCSINKPPSHAVLWIRFPQYATKIANNPWQIPLVTNSQSKKKLCVRFREIWQIAFTDNSRIIAMSHSWLFGWYSKVCFDCTLN